MKLVPMCVVVVALVLTGCASTPEESYQTSSLLDARTGALSSGTALAVAVEGDGSYAGKPYPNSGNMTSTAMMKALSSYTSKLSAAPGYLSERDARAAASTRQAEYLVYLSILHWEERATEWSGKPDRIEVEIRLIDLSKDEIVESTLITGSSKWATFGGDHPQDLLIKPFNDYAKGLFGA